jgi:hypothetical protein
MHRSVLPLHHKSIIRWILPPPDFDLGLLDHESKMHRSIKPLAQALEHHAFLSASSGVVHNCPQCNEGQRSGRNDQ